MDEKNSIFYLDRIPFISWWTLVLIILILSIIIDLLTEFLLDWTYKVISSSLYIAYISRLASIVLGIFILRISFYDLNSVIDDIAERFSRREIRDLKISLNFLNNPWNHLISGITANILYLIILYTYIFPILHWKPFHVFSNTLWVGILGIGIYVAVSGLKFVSKALGLISELELIDPYNSDGIGGLTPISKILVKIVVLLGIASGLWVGSLIGSIGDYVILIILIIGLITELSILGYITYRLHKELVRVKSKLLNSHISSIKDLLDKGWNVSNKVELLLKLFREQIILIQLDRMRTWPININTLLELTGLLLGFAPLILDFIF